MSDFRKHAFFGRVCDGIGFAFSLRELQPQQLGLRHVATSQAAWIRLAIWMRIKGYIPKQ
jgi:hypothetical protein